MSGGRLAIDIETASPHKEPGRGDFGDTSYFELVAVGIGYQDEPGTEVEIEVLFRNGGWDSDSTSELLRETHAWYAEREPETVLTYNGEGFDVVHLQNWAEDVAENGGWSGADDGFAEMFESHKDLMPAAVNHFSGRIEDWRDYVALEDACEWEGIEVPQTKYANYDLGGLTEHSAIDDDYVDNSHIGGVLGEAYVEHQTRGTTDTEQFRELEQLLLDYTQADIEPLFELHDCLEK